MKLCIVKLVFREWHFVCVDLLPNWIEMDYAKGTPRIIFGSAMNTFFF